MTKVHHNSVIELRKDAPYLTLPGVVWSQDLIS